MLCSIEMNLDKTRAVRENKINYLVFPLTKEMVKLYKCVISSIDISMTLNIAALQHLASNTLYNKHAVLSVSLLTDLCSIEMNLDKSRVEKNEKINFLFFS